MIAANGRRALVSSETVLYGYDMETRKRLWRTEIDVVNVALSPDAAFAAVTAIATDDVILLDAATGEGRRTLTSGRQGLIQALAFGAGDRIAIPGGDDGSVIVLSFDRAATRLVLSGGHSTTVCGLAFGRDGTDLVSSCEDGSVCLWKL